MPTTYLLLLTVTDKGQTRPLGCYHEEMAGRSKHILMADINTVPAHNFR
jgi:hypothetical protein